MRTTLTLDDDVAARLKRLERASRRPYKELVNAALREGLERLDPSPNAPRAPVKLSALDLGACLLGTLDDVSELLELSEGPRHA